jgi:hypothetical protein
MDEHDARVFRDFQNSQQAALHNERDVRFLIFKDAPYGSSCSISKTCRGCIKQVSVEDVECDVISFG